ncbi:PA-phosphatase [Candidatus Cerribacteria bacterium 'Amazon FNV 2010 28 9']|uniref:PA-phosphatase n=1 Tax=Candidatus Cerribacteria bacterium 'Amazon FNV 2010 28 9' TaxID=2081795 RepID=A0A317JQJ9_9BACT|nr:MAG: PA-phosphatase [Candidatus Cerribacteria bacterium 'Amazon FNV 2010 28 9']
MVLNLPVMKRLMICAPLIMLTSLVHAQNDTSKVSPPDSVIDVSTPDTLNSGGINLPTSTPEKRQQIYKLKPGVDIPIFVVGAGWSAYAFTKIYSKSPSTEEEILALNKNDINGFDRWAVRPFSESLDRISYYPFFASMPLPFLFLFGNTKKDFFKLSGLYLEAMSITGFLYTGSVYFTNRYRPYAYTDESSMEQRTRGGAKNSFYAGHVALVATSTFFMAKVYSDYHPESNAKWVFYTLAGTTTAVTAYLRYRAGQHFPTDLLLGIAQGTVTGLLVPHFHKNKLLKNNNLAILPFSSGRNVGLSMLYKL